MPAQVKPGATELTLVNNTSSRLKSGSYALLCFLTDGAGSPPHVVKAKMLQEVTVS